MIGNQFQVEESIMRKKEIQKECERVRSNARKKGM